MDFMFEEMLGWLGTYASHLSTVHHSRWFREYWDLNYSMPKSLDQSDYLHYCSTGQAVIDGCSEAGSRSHAIAEVLPATRIEKKAEMIWHLILSVACNRSTQHLITPLL